MLLVYIPEASPLGQMFSEWGSYQWRVLTRQVATGPTLQLETAPRTEKQLDVQ